jgi:hypothetical protein
MCAGRDVSLVGLRCQLSEVINKLRIRCWLGPTRASHPFRRLPPAPR